MGMNSISKAGVGQYILLAEVVLKILGVDLPDGSVAAAVNGLIIFLGVVLAIIGHFSRKDLHFGLLRK